MKNSIWKILCIVVAVIFIAAGIYGKVAGACPTMIECTSGQVPMKCHWAYIATAYIGIAGGVLALCAAFTKTTDAHRLGAIAIIVAAIVFILILSPVGIGVCSHETSTCVITRTIVYVLCAINIILGIVMAVKANPDEADLPKMKL